MRSDDEIKKAVEEELRWDPDIKRKIEDALKRRWEADAANIQVETQDGEVILNGSVRSWVEREEAERAAWAAPGIRKVVNQISIKP